MCPHKSLLLMVINKIKKQIFIVIVIVKLYNGKIKSKCNVVCTNHPSTWLDHYPHKVPIHRPLQIQYPAHRLTPSSLVPPSSLVTLSSLVTRLTHGSSCLSCRHTGAISDAKHVAVPLVLQGFVVTV